MRATLLSLIDRLDSPELPDTNVIHWGSPVPSFGDLSRSRVATLGLNPSNREFVDADGNELDGEYRRFHTLNSLGLSRWSDADARQLRMIEDLCRTYFLRNPYDGWFKELDHVISGTSASYYFPAAPACHLDLIPYATSCKWTELTSRQRSTLLDAAGDTLGLLLRESPVRLLVLNGKTVVHNLEKIADTVFGREAKRGWTLPRQTGPGVKGYAYTGVVQQVGGVRLKREVAVVGFNHNIQSSFGVTTRVKSSIRRWIAGAARTVSW